jgi:hypothetical protein
MHEWQKAEVPMNLTEKLPDVNRMSLEQLAAELEERLASLRYAPAKEVGDSFWPEIYRHAGGVIVKFYPHEIGSNLSRENMARYLAWLRQGNKGTYRMAAIDA